jgi:anti-anti-sigma factor
MGTGLKIEVEGRKEGDLIRLEGRLDASTVPLLEKEMNELLSRGQKKFALDLSGVDYLSSAGMRLLLSLTKQLKGISGLIIFFRLNTEVMEIIKMGGFERILNITQTEQEAWQALNLS